MTQERACDHMSYSKAKRARFADHSAERKVRNLEVRGSIPLRSTIQEVTRLGGFFVFSEVWLRSIVQCAVTVKCRFYTNLIQLEKLPKHRPQNRSVLRFFIYKSESKR